MTPPVGQASGGLQTDPASFRFVLALLLEISLVACSGPPESFAPVDPIPPGTFDHRLLDAVLRDHVQDGWVSYPDIAADPRFAAYVASLNRVDPSALSTKEDRLAFWINTYNALAIQGILDGGSPRTLLGRYEYFLGHEHHVGGRAITLWTVEREILIPTFQEPRIHFAIVCASRTCPKLRSEAYTPETLQRQLEDAARVFINDPTRNRFDPDAHVAWLSTIFVWYQEEFVKDAGSLLRYVAKYVADPKLADELITLPYREKFLEYDWRLNGTPLPR